MNPALAAAIARRHAEAPMPKPLAPTPGRVLHMDGDYAAYHCSGKDDTPAGTARSILLARIEKAQRAAGAERTIVHLSSNDCDKGKRYLIAVTKPYQGQRDAGRKPDNWYVLREFMEGYEGPLFTTKLWSDREADDGCAFHCEFESRNGVMPAVHTRDKDFRMFCGIHLDWLTYLPHTVQPDTFCSMDINGKVFGHRWFWLQMLMGDSADNIPGCKGIGEEGAPQILSSAYDNESAFAAVSSMYKAKYGTEAWADRFVEQAALLWMRTDARAHIGNFREVLDKPYGEIFIAIDRMSARVDKALADLQALKE